MINWPIAYRDALFKNSALPRHYKLPVSCVNAKYYCGINADGTLHYCLKPGMPAGPNLKELGVIAAWNQLIETSPECVACASTNTIEYSLAAYMNKDAILNALRFQFLFD